MNDRDFEAIAAEAIRKLNDIPDGDPEHSHFEADMTLLSFVRALGFDAVAEAWEATGPKWYA